MSASINEIAKKANVSPATVSRVFSGNGYVKEETRKRVLEVATSMGYVPRTALKINSDSLASKQVAIIIPNTHNDYYQKISRCVEEYLRPFGLSVLVCSSNEDPEKEYEYLSVIRDFRAAGIIFVPSTYIERKTVELVEKMDAEGTPVVLLDRDIRSTKMDGVFMDNYSSAYQSISAFLEEGHRNIGFIGSNPTSNADMDRVRGYRDAMRNNGVPVNEEYIVHGGLDFDSAYRTTRKLLQDHSEITALFISISRITAGCLFALAELGLNYPDNISIICGGQPNVGTERTSFIAYPTDEIGRECAKMLYNKLSATPGSAEYRRRTFIDVELILKGSERLMHME